MRLFVTIHFLSLDKILWCYYSIQCLVRNLFDMICIKSILNSISGIHALFYNKCILFHLPHKIKTVAPLSKCKHSLKYFFQTGSYHKSCSCKGRWKMGFFFPKKVPKKRNSSILTLSTNSYCQGLCKTQSAFDVFYGNCYTLFLVFLPWSLLLQVTYRFWNFFRCIPKKLLFWNQLYFFILWPS